MPDRNHIANALGVRRSIDYNLITEAIAAHISENPTLDWKRTYPEDGDEFAKDVAAFANSRGGSLVYGVAELQDGGAQANEAMLVELTDQKMRRLTAWANTRIEPPVNGIEYIPVRQAPDATHGFLVVVVPASPELPHMIGQQNQRGIPYRTGTSTAWMTEREVERAYRDRFTRRTEERAHLDDLTDQTLDYLDPGTPWLVASAVTATSADFPELADRETITAMVRAIDNIRVGEHEYHGRLTQGLSVGSAIFTPQRGLRRWMFRASETGAPAALSAYAHLELHRDGSFLLAEQERSSFGTGDDRQAVSDDLILDFASDLVRLSAAVADLVGNHGDTTAKVEMRPALKRLGQPLALLASERLGPGIVGRPQQPPWTRHVRHPLPVITALPSFRNEEERADAARLIAADIVEQFGFEVDQLRW